MARVHGEFVEVTLLAWDTHQDTFGRTAKLATELDTAMSALLDDVRASGRLESTIVACVTEFGRSPQINPQAGRGHYPTVTPAVLAGGGIARGKVIGATDEDGHEVVETPISLADLFATFAHALRIEPDEVSMSAAGRPITTIDPQGRVVRELLG